LLVAPALLVVVVLFGNGHLRTATIRPEDILLSLDAKYDLHGKIAKINFEGSATRIWIKCRDTRFVVLTSDDFKPGQNVRIHLPPDKIRIFPSETKSD
jgi:ABC-type sugar transport system ATPase subunit